MADQSAQADIRGMDIQKLAIAYEQEARIFKRFVRNATTSAREIRWFNKTAGILDSEDTSGMTASLIANTSSKSRPVVVEQSWTRNTSYVRKYFVESPWISDEDIKDSDVDILTTNVQDLVIAVEDQIDKRIWDILTESQSAVNINTNASTAAWDAASGQDPVEDVMEALQEIREQTKRPVENGVLFLSPYDHKALLVWLITTKGSSVPAFASQRVGDGVIMNFLGLDVVISNNVTADYALVTDAAKACTWKSFVPITTALIKDPGIGTKIRVWEEGEAILTDPKAVHLTTNTVA